MGVGGAIAAAFVRSAAGAAPYVRLESNIQAATTYLAAVPRPRLDRHGQVRRVPEEENIIPEEVGTAGAKSRDDRAKRRAMHKPRISQTAKVST